MREVLMRLQTPYGILLRHRYSARTAKLNSSNAALHAAARKTGGDVKLLPVLIRWTATKDVYEVYDGCSECSADVFPMTQTHVGTILAHIRAKAKRKEGEEERKETKKLSVDLLGTDAEWISHHPPESIPFYSPNFPGTSTIWKEDIEEAIENTGNESRPHEEDSIYLTHVVVCQEERGGRRDRCPRSVASILSIPVNNVSEHWASLF
ncbi:hypothetical protein B0H14DRAFT_2707848 [Mycena olivaceomarginata]|nr:hypothetical protein B0H14DRAFT_2707848 [Mycena olivaceomarginata]